MKTFLFKSMMGIFFGAFVTVVVTYATVIFGEGNMLDGKQFIKDSAGYILCAWLFTVSPLYFEIRSLNLAIQTILHFTTVTILYFILSLGFGWIPLQFKNILMFFSVAIFIYAVSWICFYLYFKNISKKMNRELKHIK
ncbi:DUF3021 domain-containing protein [Halobacillus mangrovi]|uniref:DUF3021 domain-containing protein n=1 Tax=Halobacillus mangrovi TaxID=402384 RepID=A0A1W5ZWP0_9BACI|nr:DUF3021 domain-containing protein [Halobacillus mangrovi]ARI77661.1 hypothetical protein HM131_12745 [Halobacillus mangrovi]